MRLEDDPNLLGAPFPDRPNVKVDDGSLASSGRSIVDEYQRTVRESQPGWGRMSDARYSSWREVLGALAHWWMWLLMMMMMMMFFGSFQPLYQPQPSHPPSTSQSQSANSDYQNGMALRECPPPQKKK